MKRTVAFGAALLILISFALVRADSSSPSTESSAAAASPTASTQPGVTLITLHLTQAMPEDVFNEISKQSGVKFQVDNNLWDQDALQMPMDVNVTNRPFWPVVLKVCRMWNVAPQFGYNSGKAIHLNLVGGMNPNGDDQQAPPPPPTYEHDGFVAIAQAFNRQQSINYLMPGRAQNFSSIQLMVYADPALHVESFNQQASQVVATDDAGHSMSPQRNRNNSFGGPANGGYIYNVNVPLNYPENAGTKITDLKCTLSMRAADQIETLTVDHPLTATDTTKKFDDWTLIFHSLTKTGNGYEAKIAMIGPEDNTGNNMWNLFQSAQLVDDKGRIFSYGGGGGGGGNGTYNYTVNYNGNNGNDFTFGDPAKWSLDVPLHTHAVRVPVEFKDLPLP